MFFEYKSFCWLWEYIELMQYPDFLERAQIIVSIICGMATIILGIWGITSYKHQKEIEAKIECTGELLKQRQISYISLNDLLISLTDKKYTMKDNKNFHIFLNEHILDKKNLINFINGVDRYLSCLTNFQDGKIYSETELKLYDFYKKNSIYFSEEINNKFISLIRTIVAYRQIAIIQYFVYIYKSCKFNIYTGKKTKERAKEIMQEMFYIICYCLEDDINKQTEEIHKILIGELNSPKFGLNTKSIYPQHIDISEKLDSLTNFVNSNEYKILVDRLDKYVEYKLSKSEFEEFCRLRDEQNSI